MCVRDSPHKVSSSTIVIGFIELVEMITKGHLLMIGFVELAEIDSYENLGNIYICLLIFDLFLFFNLYKI